VNELKETEEFSIMIIEQFTGESIFNESIIHEDVITSVAKMDQEEKESYISDTYAQTLVEEYRPDIIFVKADGFEFLKE